MISLPYIPNKNLSNQKEMLIPCIDNYSTYISFHNYHNQIVNNKKEIKQNILNKKNNETHNVFKRDNNFINKKLPSISKRRVFSLTTKKMRKNYSANHTSNSSNNTSINQDIKIQDSFVDFKSIKDSIMYTMITLPKTKLTLEKPSFNFYVNRTYRKQIPLYMQHRINWHFVTSKSEGYNFRWKYFAGKINYKDYKYNQKTPMEKLKMINVFQKYANLGNKEKMFINLLKYCNDKHLNVFKYIPFTIILSKNYQYKQTIDSLSSLMNYSSSLSSYSIKKKEGYFSSSLYSDLFKMNPHEVNMNHSIDNVVVYFPKAFISSKNYWIVKPIDLYQGLGIKVTNNINEVVAHSKELFKGIEKRTAELKMLCDKMQKEIKPKTYKTNNIIIQKYLDSPLLYYNRKFDIRCYVLVDHCFNVFVCREGHLKACSVNYDLSTTDKFSHLTNYSLQKQCEHFSKFEQGNEISYKQFKQSLQSQGYNADETFKSIFAKMKELIMLSMNAVGKKLSTVPNALSFQIFGYDFIIDSNLNPYILEINDNPGLEISSELISHLIPRMVDDAFRLTIDKIFDTEYDSEVCSKDEKGNFVYKSKYKLEGYDDTENVFEFLCNINKYPLND